MKNLCYFFIHTDNKHTHKFWVKTLNLDHPQSPDDKWAKMSRPFKELWTIRVKGFNPELVEKFPD